MMLLVVVAGRTAGMTMLVPPLIRGSRFQQASSLLQQAPQPLLQLKQHQPAPRRQTQHLHRHMDLPVVALVQLLTTVGYQRVPRAMVLLLGV
jgi:hypothetical protein